jgi:hypothetical protein
VKSHHMKKQKIQAIFYSKTPLKTDEIQLIGWSGNHWDNISYFPKNCQIALIRAGEGGIIVGEVSHPIHKNQFFLIHPNLVHSETLILRLVGNIYNKIALLLV